MNEYKIDAKNKKLGRLASEIAKVLQGKHDPSYEPHKRGDTKVIVSNVGDVEVSGKKAEQKIYYSHTTHRPGRLRKRTYEDVFEKDPEWVLKHAVSGMLPKNRLRDKRLKMIEFEGSSNK